MRLSRRVRLPLVAAACIAMLAACTKSTTRSNASPSASTSPASPLSGSANVFAAQSLKGAFDKIDAAFMAAHPGVSINPNYNGSGTLVTQIQQGAPADVFVSADNPNMNKLTTTGAIATSTVKTLLRNVLQIVVKKGNPKGIKALADLARPDLAVVLGDPASVPAGKYAQQAFQQAGVTVTAKSLETNVTAVLTKVALGEADAGVVYVTDVKVAIAGGQPVEGVDIPTAQNVVATYPVGPLSHAPNPAVASAYISYLLSPAGQATLASFGFLPPA